MNTKYLLSLFLIILLVFLITSCTTGQVVKEPDVIKVGVILPMIGKAAAYGKEVRSGLELALEDINKDKTRIELIYEEEACDPKQAVTAYQHLSKVRGVKNIIGALCSVSTLAIAPLAEQDKVILFTPASAAESISDAGDYIFRNHGRSSTEMKVLAEYASKKYKTFAIIYDSSNDGMIAGKDYFKKFVEENGGKVLFIEGFKGDELDFRTILLKFKKQENDVEAVFLPAFQNQLVLLVKQMNELGIYKPILADKSVEISDTINALDELAEGIIYPVAEYSENTNLEFWNKYKRKYGKSPPVWAAQAYDNLKILAMIFEKCKPEDTVCVKDELYKIKDYPGVAGLTSFDKNGDVVKKIVVKEIRNREFVPVSDKQTTKIGVILPLTGKGANYGEWSKNGLDLVVKEINSLHDYPYHLELVYEDDEGIPKNGVTAFQKLISIHKPSVVTGLILSKVALSVAPIAEENKIVLLSTGASSDALRTAGDYVFRIRESGIFHGHSMAEYVVKDLDIKNVGVLYANAENGITYAEAFKEKVLELGEKIEFYEAFNEDETDFRTYLIKAKNRDIKVLYVPGLATEIGKILRQAKELGLEIQFLSSPGAQNPKLIEIAGQAAEGLIYTYPGFNPDSSDTLVQEFVKRYEKGYGKTPEFLAANSYDAIKILAQVFESHGITSDQIKNGLYSVKDYHGVAGTLSFDEYGDVIKSVALKTMKNGEFVLYEEK